MPRKFDKTEWRMTRHADMDLRPGVRWDPPPMPSPTDAEIEGLIHELTAVKNKISGDPTKADLYNLIMEFEPQLRRSINSRMSAGQDLGFELFTVAKIAIEHGLDGRRPQEVSDEELGPIVRKAIDRAIKHLARRVPPSQWPENHAEMIQKAVLNAASYLDQVGEIGRDSPPVNWSEMNNALRPMELPEKMTDQIPGFEDNPQYVNSPRFPGAQGWN